MPFEKITDREDLEDTLESVITDSFGPDWGGRDGARSFIRWAEERCSIEDLIAVLNGEV